MHERHESQEPADEFVGFNKARSIMWCHEVRSRTFLRMTETSFIGDPRVKAVHVNNTSRTDRVFLTAFDRTGEQIGSDILYIDDPTQKVDIAPEFDHDFTGMPVNDESGLGESISRDDGWVIDMRALRTYDLTTDRRQTQRAVFLAHLPDLMAAGLVRGFSLGSFGDSNAA